MDLPDEIRQAIQQELPDEADSIGFVPCNDLGQVWLAEPTGHYGGVSATFPKVRLRKREKSDEALLRCIGEKVGVEPESVFPVKGTWRTSHSRTKFFAGLTGPDPMRDWG